MGLFPKRVQLKHCTLFLHHFLVKAWYLPFVVIRTSVRDFSSPADCWLILSVHLFTGVVDL